MGGTSVTKPAAKEERGAMMIGQTTINKQWGLRFATFGQISDNIPCLLIQCLNRGDRGERWGCRASWRGSTSVEGVGRQKQQSWGGKVAKGGTNQQKPTPMMVPF
jgi:hypothetical protein